MVVSQIRTVSEDDGSVVWLARHPFASSEQEPGRRAQVVGPDVQVQFVHIPLAVQDVHTVCADVL